MILWKSTHNWKWHANHIPNWTCRQYISSTTVWTTHCPHGQYYASQNVLTIEVANPYLAITDNEQYYTRLVDMDMKCLVYKGHYCSPIKRAISSTGTYRLCPGFIPH